MSAALRDAPRERRFPVVVFIAPFSEASFRDGGSALDTVPDTVLKDYHISHAHHDERQRVKTLLSGGHLLFSTKKSVPDPLRLTRSPVPSLHWECAFLGQKGSSLRRNAG